MKTWIGYAACFVFAAVAPAIYSAQEIFSDNPWEREMGAGLAVDQEQTKEGLLSGPMIGQVFTPALSRLERLDIITKNRTDLTPGRIRLWRWQGSYEKTIQGRPMWEDALDFSGQDAPVLRHYFPGVAVEPGQKYLIDCVRPSESFYMGGVQEDVYPGGIAVTNGRPRPGWDMWFRTFGSAAVARPLTARPLPKPSPIQPRPPRPPATVTKQLYLDVIRKFVWRSMPDWTRQAGRRANNLMFYTGFLFKFDGQKQWAKRVSEWLRSADQYLKDNKDYGESPWFVSHFGFGVKWFRGNELWTEKDEELARRVMLTATRRLARSLERGAMNRAMWDVLCTRLAAELYPDAPEAKGWRTFSDRVWHDWADYDDINEDSAHYNTVFFHFMLAYLYLTDGRDIFKRPGMRHFVDRYRDVLTPSGMMVGWGDSLGVGGDWGGWVAMFETAAAATGDGTYRWAAHRVLEAHRRYILEDEPLQQAYEDMQNLVWAYIGADDSVKPVRPELRSGVYTIAYPRRNPLKLRREKGLAHYSLEHRQVPWKLVMRDSPREDACYALWGLLPFGGHGHADAPALLALYADGTLLMHDTAYLDKRWQDHNLMFGVRLSGGKLGPEPAETEVKRFFDGKVLSYADIAWKDYAGWGMDFRREILFVKGLGWWVRDRTDAREEFRWYLGPMWHVDRILGRGETWFDVDYPAPNSFAWPTANGTDHLLIYFTPCPGATVDYADMTRRVRKGKPWYSSAPWAVYQCRGPIAVSPDAQAHFNSLLLPLRRGERTAACAENLRILFDEPGASALQLLRGRTTWTVALINDHRARAVGPITTDARAVVVREVPGQRPAVEAFEATTVRMGTRRLMQSEKAEHFATGW